MAALALKRLRRNSAVISISLGVSIGVSSAFHCRRATDSCRLVEVLEESIHDRFRDCLTENLFDSHPNYVYMYPQIDNAKIRC